MLTQTALQCVPLPALDPERIPIASQVLALFGRAAELHPLVLQSLFLRAARGERLGVVVGDNRLNGYALARLARRYEFDPSALLAQIEFSRPFTCHQLHHGVVDLVPEKTNTWRALYVLGLLETFWDEDIRYPIAARLLDEVLSRLRLLARQNLPVLVTVSPPPKETPRQEFITRVLGAADALARPSGAASQRVKDVPAWQPPPSVVEHFAEQMSMW